MCQCQAHQPFVLQKLWLVLIQKENKIIGTMIVKLDKCIHGNEDEEMQSNNN